jgi:predicted metal-dependent peptidase
VLKQFFGTIHRGERSTSIRKMSRKYPWIHPGMRRGHIPNVLVCVDESGSMSKEAIELLFGELASFSQRFTFDVCKFDTVCGPVETWRKGAPPPTVASSRTKCGGTNFNAAMDLIEAPENRGRWDGVLMLTDGICFQPRQSRIKRGWVLTPGQKLDWETQELVIELTETIRAKGAWR